MRKNAPHGALLILALALTAFFYQLGARDMWGRLETEAAVCARNMLDTGDFAVPLLNEKPFVDNRPAGAFWLVAGSFALTGSEGEWAARLPAALAGLLCVLLVYAMGRRAGGRTAGLLSALALMGMVSFLWLGRMSQQDMPLTLLTMAAYGAFWGLLDARSRLRSILFSLAFQVAVGSSVLVKGPAVAFCLLPLVAYVAYARRWRDVKWGALLLTLPVGLALAGSWYFHIWTAHPELRIQLVERFTNQRHIHVAPFYDYLIRLPGLLGPALLLLPLAFFGFAKADREERRGPLGLFLIGFVGQLVIYSLFPSKRTHYLLPALPLLSVAIGIAMAAHRFEERPFFARTGLVLAALPPLLVLGCTVAMPFLGLPTGVMSVRSQVGTIVGTLVLAGFAAWIAIRHLIGGRRRTWRLGWISWVLGLTFVMGNIVPGQDSRLSLKPFAREVGRVVETDAPLASLSTHAGLEYYTGRSIRDLGRKKLDPYLADPDHYLIVLDDAIDAVPEARRRIVIHHAGMLRKPAYLLRGTDRSLPDNRQASLERRWRPR